MTERNYSSPVTVLILTYPLFTPPTSATSSSTPVPLTSTTLSLNFLSFYHLTNGCIPHRPQSTFLTSFLYLPLSCPHPTVLSLPAASQTSPFLSHSTCAFSVVLHLHTVSVPNLQRNVLQILYISFL